MPLPDYLRDAIDAELAVTDSAALARSAREMSDRYRRGDFAPLNTAADRAAYLAVRAPATYAACSRLFAELARRLRSPIRTLLDLGAGPGTASWAASQFFPLEHIGAVERDPQFIALGKRLAGGAGAPARVLADAAWLQADLRSLPTLEPHDLLVISYAAGELRDPMPLFASAWKLARAALLLIEPGTPRGFETILRAREWLIAQGGWLPVHITTSVRWPPLATGATSPYAWSAPRCTAALRPQSWAMKTRSSPTSWPPRTRSRRPRPASFAIR